MASYEKSPEEQPLEELDLTPYEEDDDATLHRKFVAAKMARKRAEEDLKLLCNRIGLLKSEEHKVSFLQYWSPTQCGRSLFQAVKKIDETRKRASDIVGQRRRNMELQQEKLMRQQQLIQEQNQRTQMNLYIKEENTNKVTQNKKMSYMKTKQEAMDTKTEKQMVRDMWEQNKQAEQQRAYQIKSMIKQQQSEAQTKRQMDLVDKQNRTRAQIEERLMREQSEQMLYEQEVARMEKEELDLIMRLKNTKLVEEQAHQQLESAIKDPLDQTSRSIQQQSQRKGSANGKRTGTGQAARR